MDRRLTAFSGEIALSSLRGQIDAARFTDGKLAQISQPLADLLRHPHGPRDRQVLFGDSVTVIDRRQGYAFVQAAKDGYCGWLPETALGPRQRPTHWVAAVASHLYSSPKVQAPEVMALPIGAQITVLDLGDSFAQTPLGYLPRPHIRSLDDRPTDPVSVAESLLHAPYLWGGNSAAGIDCSGLVQAGFLACGLPCPGDSDMQQSLGSALPEDTALRRGDLLFWKGHVALVVDEARLIHANGHSMSVAYEGISATITRIEAAGGGPVTARRRV